MKTLPRNTVLTGDARAVLQGLLAESVDTVVASPPYFNLRDYAHPGQLGREPTVAEYVESLRAVMCEVRRVLKPRGSAWVILGDGYARSDRAGAAKGSLLLVPQRVALALSTDKWWVRNVCVFQKANPLPASAPDRLSPTYEVVLFVTKQRHYFFDLDAIRVPHRSVGHTMPRATEAARRYQGGNSGLGALKAAGRVGHPLGRNPGDVWRAPTACDRLGHQATFPQSLIERPIRAGCPERICVQCDRAWTRPVRVLTVHTAEGARTVRKLGALQRCDCFAPSRPGVVLDPFMGSGTTAVVAERLGRDWLGVELNPAYAALTERRVRAARRAA